MRPEFRKRGIGKRLIEAVAQIGAERHCGRFEWTALNWNSNALAIYERLGAKRMDESIILRMNAAGMLRLAERAQ